MTAGELLDRMSYAEMLEQMAYDMILQKDREKTERLADKGMSQKRPRRR